MAIKYTLEEIGAMFPDNSQGEITAEVLRNFALSVVGGAYSASDEYVENQISSTSIVGDKLGASTASNSTKFAAGAPYEDSKGAVYIYDADGTNKIRIVASDGLAGDNFGTGVAMSETHIIIGAPYVDSTSTASVNCGAIYIYNIDGTGEIKVLAENQNVSNTFFGADVDINSTHAVIGCYGLAAGYIYTVGIDGVGLTGMSGFDVNSGDGFGQAVAITASRVFGSSSTSNNDKGLVYSFDYDGSNELKIVADDGVTDDAFGTAIAAQGKYLIVGADGNDGFAYIMNTDGTNQIKLSEPSSVREYYGFAVGISDTRVIVGALSDDEAALNAGAAFTYRLDGSDSTRIMASDAAAEDKLGYNQTLSINSTQIVVGVPYSDINGVDSGRVYTFDIPESVQAFDNVYSKIDIADDPFSNFSFAEDGSIIVPNLSNELITTSKSLVTKDYSDTNISNTLTALESAPAVEGAFRTRVHNPGVAGEMYNDMFGEFVAAYGDLIVVGASLDDGPGGTTEVRQGSVTILHQDGTVLNTFYSPNPVNNNYFGFSVSINKNFIIVGEKYGDYEGRSSSGRGYLFDHSGNYILELTPDFIWTDCYFGSDCDTSDSMIVMGSNGARMVFMYTDQGEFIDYVSESDTGFGFASAVSNTVIVAGTGAGGAFVYSHDATRLFELTGPANFGYSVACSDTHIVVGAHTNGTGSVFIYTIDGTLVQEVQAVGAPGLVDDFGYDVQIKDSTIIIGERWSDGVDISEVGSSSVFNTDGDFLFRMDSPDEFLELYADFGYSVALTDEYYVVGAVGEGVGFGGTAGVTGDWYEGSIYIFDRASGTTVYNSSHIDGVGLDGLIQTDGANDMDSGYVPVNNLSVVTKEYVNNSATSELPSSAITFAAPSSSNLYDELTYAPALNNSIFTKITATDGAASDYYGIASAISDNKIIIGAESDDDNGSGSGSVYIYNTDGTNEVKIIASDGAAGDNFGYSVAVTDTKAIVGARGDDDNGSSSGSAYIYNIDGSNEIKIQASDGAAGDNFGYSVAVTSTKIIVGSRYNLDKGAIYIYDLDGTNEVKVVASDGVAGDAFGRSLAAIDTKIIVGAYHAISTNGAVYVYDIDGTNEVKIIASDGAAGDNFGNSVGISDTKIMSGIYNTTGAVYVYDHSGANEVKIVNSDALADDGFGYSAAINNSNVVVGAFNRTESGPYAGAAYLYDIDGANEIKIVPSDGVEDAEFGYSVAINKYKILIGAEGDDDKGSYAGSAYIYNIPKELSIHQEVAVQSSNSYTDLAISSIVIPEAGASTTVANTFTAPQRTSTSATTNNIDFTLNNNFTLTATAALMGAPTLTGCTGQAGTIIITSAENITGWDALYLFKTVPTGLTDTEVFQYFIQSETQIRIGRIA